MSLGDICDAISDGMFLTSTIFLSPFPFCMRVIIIIDCVPVHRFFLWKKARKEKQIVTALTKQVNKQTIWKK